MITHAALIAIAATTIAGPPPATPQGRDVGREIEALVEADWIEQDRLFAAAHVNPVKPVTVNAQGVTTRQDATGAVDGMKNGRFGFHVAVGETDPWWQVDLGQDYQLDRVLGAYEQAEAQAHGLLVKPSLD